MATDQLSGMDEVELEEYFNYLDELRESGKTNMLGASSYLVREYGMSSKTASAVLSKWMETFGERHSA